MHEEHWFDRLNQKLMKELPRRSALRTTGSLLAALALGGGPVVEAVAKKRKKDVCNRTYREKTDRTHCKFIREQCKVPPKRAFCILNETDADGVTHKVADCCLEGEKCCKGRCVPLNSHEFCGRGCGKPCKPNEICANGRCRPCGSGQQASSGAAAADDGSCGDCPPGTKPCMLWDVRGPIVGCIRSDHVCCDLYWCPPGNACCDRNGAGFCGPEGHCLD